MLSYFRRHKESPKDDTKKADEAGSSPNSPSSTPAAETAARPSFFARLKSGLTKTREKFSQGLSRLLLGKKTIDEELHEQLETQLLSADVGIAATALILDQLKDRMSRQQMDDPDALLTLLREVLESVLTPIQQPLVITGEKKPYILLMVGINGAGKTTTIGKLAKRFQDQGLSVMLAAGDTFRAAAVEQLQAWGQSNNVPVIAQASGGDSASVIYDAINAAKARGVDVLIADTAGRLHTQSHLMAELQKVKRVIHKLVPEGPDEVMLVLDASIGQNALVQAKEFGEAVNVTGLTMTKLDGTAKGGIIFAIAQQQNIPLRFIGVGEDIDDLRDFNAKDFVDALFE